MQQHATRKTESSLCQLQECRLCAPKCTIIYAILWFSCYLLSLLCMQDPKGWSDILTPRKLHGYCGKHGCGGKDAVCEI